VHKLSVSVRLSSDAALAVKRDRPDLFTQKYSSFASKIFIHPCKPLQSRRGVTQLGEPGEMMTDHGFSLLLL
jgi:hypothetical protein